MFCARFLRAQKNQFRICFEFQWDLVETSSQDMRIALPFRTLANSMFNSSVADRLRQIYQTNGSFKPSPDMLQSFSLPRTRDRNDDTASFGKSAVNIGLNNHLPVRGIE